MHVAKLATALRDVVQASSAFPRAIALSWLGWREPSYSANPSRVRVQIIGAYGFIYYALACLGSMRAQTGYAFVPNVDWNCQR
ncbi:MAG: hypothetical protein P4L46_11515 [Fimbriimonas sp.]|nr:hypothetical protein [Fimbriimonas sp.]